MKRSIYCKSAISAALMLTVISAGCTKSDPEGTDGNTDRVIFRATTVGNSDPAQAAARSIAPEYTPQTRTTDGGDKWSDGDGIGIFMIGENGDLADDILTVGTTTADNIRYNAHPESDASKAGFSPAGDIIYYPQQGKVDFIAYYPHGSSGSAAGEVGTDYNYNISVADQSDPAKIDVMWAKTEGVSRSQQAVELEFSHVMSKITLNIEAGGGVDPAKIEQMTSGDVRFEGMPKEATLSLEDGVVNAKAGSEASFDAAVAGTPTTGYKATFTAIIVPQKAGVYNDRKVIFTVDGEDYEWEIDAAVAFKAGKNAVYPVTVKETAIIVGAANITDWEGTDANPDDEEITVAGIHTPDDLVKFSTEWNQTGSISQQTERAAAQARLLARWSSNGKADGAIKVWMNLDMSSVTNFTPIGSQANPFTGNFDGNSYTISNLTVNINGGYVGLFGYFSGEVRNVKLEDCEIKGDKYVGGIAGENSGGTIERCTVTGGSVEGGSYVGGIVGYNNGGTIEGCEVSGGSVEGGSYVGGIAGRNSGSSTIKGCEVTEVSVTGEGDNVGGIAGWNSGSSTIEGCEVSGGSVEGGSVEGGSSVGGIAGENNSRGTIKDCTVTGGTVKGEGDYVGGIVGYNNSGTIERCTVSGGSVEGDSYVGGIAGYNSSGTIEDCTVTDGNVEGEGNFVGGIAGYNGSSTIKGCEVSGGSVEGGSYVGGIVGYNSSGTIEDCTVTDGNVEGEGNFVGGIAGYNGSSTIKGCEVSGGSVEGGSYVGGIAGHNEGKVKGCSVTGDASVTGTGVRIGGIVGNNYTRTGGAIVEGCLVSGSNLTGSSQVGGIVGSNDQGTLRGCISAPNTISGSSNTEGVVAGYNSVGSVQVCYWVEDVITDDKAVGYGDAADGGGSFDRANVTSTNNFFTTGNPSPIHLMNTALLDADSDWRWKAGSASTGWYPIPYDSSK